MWIGGASMLVGLVLAVMLYGTRDREYEDLPIAGANEISEEDVKMSADCWKALAAAIVALLPSFISNPCRLVLPVDFLS